MLKLDEIASTHGCVYTYQRKYTFLYFKNDGNRKHRNQAVNWGPNENNQNEYPETGIIRIGSIALLVRCYLIQDAIISQKCMSQICIKKY